MQVRADRWLMIKRELCPEELGQVYGFNDEWTRSVEKFIREA